MRRSVSTSLILLVAACGAFARDFLLCAFYKAECPAWPRGTVSFTNDVKQTVPYASHRSRRADHVIYFGRAESFPRLRAHIDQEKLSEPEGHVVTTARIDGSRVGIIPGNDSRGAIYGAYSLLEKLGCGFYLSYDAFPADRWGRIDVTPEPVKGKALLCGAILGPVDSGR